MNREQLPPPSPEVQHLPTLLRRVLGGEIRVPAFQREYVWSEKQIIELLESIYKGYPIGSLLFWQPTNPAISIKLDAEFPIPQTSEKKPATFILDGQQRLATIYNTFYIKDYTQPDQFNVTFDLRTQTFQHYRPGEHDSGRLHIGSLFVPKLFLQVQQALSREKDSELLLDRSIELHTAFQEYMIPIVNIKGREISDVVKIFERINNTGVRLSAVDFMRAVTWSEHFDLTDETAKLRSAAAEKNFTIPPETLVKIIAISQGYDPTPDSMLRLRELTASQLHEATDRVGRALIGAIEFLQKHMKIYSYDYVPYEAQMLVIAKLFLCTNLKPSKNTLTALSKWFLLASIGEALQGKADSVIANLVRDVERLATGDGRTFEGRIEVAPEDLVHRKFIVRRALSSALAILFAEQNARSISTGEAISAEDYMTEFTAGHFLPILGADEIESVTGSSDRRLFSNMLLVSETDRKSLKGLATTEILLSSPLKNLPAVLSSQLISEKAMRALTTKNWGGFLEIRTKDILNAAARQVATS